MIGALVSFVTWILGFIFKRPPGPSPEAQAAKAEGVATVQARGAEQALATEQRVAQAEADAPSDKAAVVSELQKGTF